MRNFSIIFTLQLLLMIFGVNNVSAQEINDTTKVAEKKVVKEKRKQNLIFIYAVHDEYTAVTNLVEVIKSAYDQAVRNEDRLIVYIPNLNKPLVIQVNTPTDTIDSEIALGEVITELRDKVSHPMRIKFDIKKILELFEENEFLNEDGNLAFREVQFTMYITSKFWKDGYNERVIPALYFSLDVQKLIAANQRFFMQVRYSKNDTNVAEYKDFPYGLKNYNKINNDNEMEPLDY